jgi:hypothetical protein
MELLDVNLKRLKANYARFYKNKRIIFWGEPIEIVESLDFVNNTLVSFRVKKLYKDGHAEIDKNIIGSSFSFSMALSYCFAETVAFYIDGKCELTSVDLRRRSKNGSFVRNVHFSVKEYTGPHID